jgi:hypothetical protein
MNEYIKTWTKCIRNLYACVCVCVCVLLAAMLSDIVIYYDGGFNDL